MTTYCLVQRGEVVEYPITEEELHNRSIPVQLATPVHYLNEPVRESFRVACIEKKNLVDGYLEVQYIAVDRTLEEMISGHKRLWEIAKERQGANRHESMWLELKRELEKHFQYLLDTWAAKRGFVDLEDMVSLQNSPLTHYRQSAADAIKLRDNVWVSFYKYLQAVDSGVKTPAGTLNEVLLQCYPIRD